MHDDDQNTAMLVNDTLRMAQVNDHRYSRGGAGGWGGGNEGGSWEEAVGRRVCKS